jgi:hypothetical protein
VIVSPKYSTAAAADELSDPMVGGTGVPKTLEQIRLSKAVNSLSGTTKTLTEIMKKSHDALSAKLRSTLDGKIDVRPTISTSERWIILPKTFEDEDYHIGWYMIGVAQALGLNVYTISYGGKVQQDTSSEAEKIGLGMFISLGDVDRAIRVRSSKKDPIEIGRTIVRAQQVIRLFSSDNLGQAALRSDHFFFGNNSGEKKVVGNTEVPVVYSAKTLGNLFREVEWAEQLRQLLITLMRESARLLTGSVVTHAVESNLLSREETITKFCASTETVVSARGRKKKTEKVKVVPHKPKPSPLLSSKEYAFIDMLSKNVFIEPSESETRRWPQYVTQKGFTVVRDALKENYADRKLFRQSYARITTSRLKEYRIGNPEARYKKKKDLTGTDLDSLLSSRKNPAATFATEVVFLDPNFGKCLLPYRALITKGHNQVVDLAGSKLRIIEDIESTGVYSEHEFQPPAVKPKVGKTELPDITLPKSYQGVKFDAKPSQTIGGVDILDKPSEEYYVSPVESVYEYPESEGEPSQKGKGKEPEPSGGLQGLQAELDAAILDSECDYIEKETNRSVLLRIWADFDKFSLTQTGKFNTVENLTRIRDAITKKVPTLFKNYPMGTEWFSSRGFNQFMEHKVNPLLLKHTKDQKDQLLTDLVKSLEVLQYATSPEEASKTLLKQYSPPELAQKAASTSPARK